MNTKMHEMHGDDEMMHVLGNQGKPMEEQRIEVDLEAQNR